MDNWKGLGNTILLGHWGDVLFDKNTDKDDILYDEQIIQLKKKTILKTFMSDVFYEYSHFTILC